MIHRNVAPLYRFNTKMLNNENKLVSHCVFTSLTSPQPHQENSVLWSTKAAVLTCTLTCKRVSIPTSQSNIDIMGCCFPGDEVGTVGTLTLSPTECAKAA